MMKGSSKKDVNEEFWSKRTVSRLLSESHTLVPTRLVMT